VRGSLVLAIIALPALVAACAGSDGHPSALHTTARLASVRPAARAWPFGREQVAATFFHYHDRIEVAATHGRPAVVYGVEGWLHGCDQRIIIRWSTDPAAVGWEVGGARGPDGPSGYLYDPVRRTLYIADYRGGGAAHTCGHGLYSWAEAYPSGYLHAHGTVVTHPTAYDELATDPVRSNPAARIVIVHGTGLMEIYHRMFGSKRTFNF
jgi:hypothetical protein